MAKQKKKKSGDYIDKEWGKLMAGLRQEMLYGCNPFRQTVHEEKPVFKKRKRGTGFSIKIESGAYECECGNPMVLDITEARKVQDFTNYELGWMYEFPCDKCGMIYRKKANIKNL